MLDYMGISLGCAEEVMDNKLAFDFVVTQVQDVSLAGFLGYLLYSLTDLPGVCLKHVPIYVYLR